MNRPNEADVQKVMKDTGMDYLQAYRHVQQRDYLREQIARNGHRFPLGRSAYDV